MTRAETAVWAVVRAGRIDGWKFRRQEQIGPYWPDFSCHALRLIIEIDGKVHEIDDVATRDHLRQGDLEALGWTVIRFTNEAVLTEPGVVADAVRRHVAAVKG